MQVLRKHRVLSTTGYSSIHFVNAVVVDMQNSAVSEHDIDHYQTVCAFRPRASRSQCAFLSCTLSSLLLALTQW